MSDDGNSIIPKLAFSNLGSKDAQLALEYGEIFIAQPENRAKLLEISKKALTTEYVTAADRMIEILAPKQK